MLDFIWPDFYKRTKDHPHWSLLEKAVQLLGHKGHALDLGCGAGRDTRYLLSQGWQVTAVDSDPTAIAILSELPQEYLRVVQSSFEDFVYEPETYDLVSSQFSLPFNPGQASPAYFPASNSPSSQVGYSPVNFSASTTNGTYLNAT